MNSTMTLVWVLKPGPQVDCKALKKILGIKKGIYTTESKSVPADIREGFSYLYAVAEILEGTLHGKDYCLVTFPEEIANSPSMSMAYLIYSGRMQARYWIDSNALTKIALLLEDLHKLQHAFDDLHSATQLLVNVGMHQEGAPSKLIAKSIANGKLRISHDKYVSYGRELRIGIKEKLKGLVLRGVVNPRIAEVS